MGIKWIRRVAGIAASAAVLGLGGCASYVTTQVTAFQNWQASDADKTYVFARSAAQQNSLEQQTYEQLVDNELSTYGFRLTDAASAHFTVSLHYGSRDQTVIVQQPDFYDPWGPWGAGGPWRPWGPYWAPPPPPIYTSQAYSIYSHKLSIFIADKASGKEVYRVTSAAQVDDPSLLRAMPYLVRGALVNFPLQNGTVRSVRIPVDPNGMAGVPANERSLQGVLAAPAGASGTAGTAAQ
jgi:Domain of unknown function (DUF4136)